MELNLAVGLRTFTATQSAHVLQKFIFDVKHKVQWAGPVCACVRARVCTRMRGWVGRRVGKAQMEV